MCIPGWLEVRVENAVPRPIPKDFYSLRVCLKHNPVIYIFYKVLQAILMQVAHAALSYLEKQNI